MKTKRLDMSLLIDINSPEGVNKEVLVRGDGNVRLGWHCKGHKPVTMAEALHRITQAEETIAQLSRGIDGMWKLIDDAHMAENNEVLT